MYTEKTTREMLKVNAQNLVERLNEFIDSVNNGDDLVSLGFTIDRIERDFNLQEILQNCEDY